MLKRIPVTTLLTGLALAGALCACGSATQQSTPAAAGASGTSSTISPVSGAPIIFAVRLGSAFKPGTLRLSPGQHFVVNVDSSVKASGLGMSGSCSDTTTKIDDGMLTVRCASGTFYYTAQRPGTAELRATVRPSCTHGHMCPQWMAEATLKVTILALEG